MVGAMTTVRRCGVVVLAFALALAGPTSAIGGEPIDPNLGDQVLGTEGGVRYAADPDTYDGTSGFASPETGCGGPRWHLVGGGSASGGPASDGWQAFDRPLDFDDADDTLDDGWLSGGYGPPGAADMTGYTMCLRDASVRYRFRDVVDAPSGLRSGSVGCGQANWHAASGSGAIATSGSWVNSSYPIDGDDVGDEPDDGWSSRVYDTVGGLGGFYVHVVCVRDQQVRYVQRDPIAIGSGASVRRRVACQNDEHVAGGGAKLSGPADEARLVSTFPYDDGDPGAVPDDGWQLKAYNLTGSEKMLTAYAVCLT